MYNFYLSFPSSLSSQFLSINCFIIEFSFILSLWPNHLNILLSYWSLTLCSLHIHTWYYFLLFYISTSFPLFSTYIYVYPDVSKFIFLWNIVSINIRYYRDIFFQVRLITADCMLSIISLSVFAHLKKILYPFPHL